VSQASGEMRAMDDAWIRAALEAEQHHGIIAVHHLELLGIDERERKRLLAAGVLHREWHGAYRVAGAPRSWRGDLLAACWAGGTRALGSHRSSLAVRGLPGGEQGMQEVMCPRWRRGRHETLIVHESKALDPVDMTIVDGIPVTTVERTIFDLGAVCSPLVVERAMEAALRQELTTFDALHETLTRLGRRGRNGAGVLRAILDEYSVDLRLTDSDREKMMLQIFRRHGLPKPVPQFVIRHDGRDIARVDAALPQWKIAFEYESYQWHTGKRAIERDNRRRRKLMAVQWSSIGVTYADLRSGGAEMCAEIFEIIRHAAA
jgi:predicted transcriptional regulator of viral defense system